MTSTPITLEKKNIFLVIGFARSGTSVITKGLQALGIDLGPQIAASDKHNSWNPSGFWEDHEVIYDIHAKVYAKLGHGTRGIRIITKDEYINNDLNDIKQYAIYLLSKRFACTQHWAFKDPSTAKIIPFWQSIFETHHIHDHYIIAVRNPLSSALSYAKLANVDIELGLLLWLTHLIPAIDETIGKKRIVVSYELMLKNPMKQLSRIRSQLHITTIPANLENFEKKFLNATLHHHRFTEEDLKNTKALTISPLCLKVYEVLMKIATDTWEFNSTEFQSAWSAIKIDFEHYYPLYCYVDTLLQRNKHLKVTLRSMQKSIAWKLFYPIRVLDNKWRQLQAKNHTKRRLETAYE